jgi:hypothetical protein
MFNLYLIDFQNLLLIGKNLAGKILDWLHRFGKCSRRWNIWYNTRTEIN